MKNKNNHTKAEMEKVKSHNNQVKQEALKQLSDWLDSMVDNPEQVKMEELSIKILGNSVSTKLTLNVSKSTSEYIEIKGE